MASALAAAARIPTVSADNEANEDTETSDSRSAILRHEPHHRVTWPYPPGSISLQLGLSEDFGGTSCTSDCSSESIAPTGSSASLIVFAGSARCLRTRGAPMHEPEDGRNGHQKRIAADNGKEYHIDLEVSKRPPGANEVPGTCTPEDNEEACSNERHALPFGRCTTHVLRCWSRRRHRLWALLGSHHHILPAIDERGKEL